MILFMANSEDLIIIHEDYILSLNTGLKKLQASDRKNTKAIYKLMLNDIDERP